MMNIAGAARANLDGLHIAGLKDGRGEHEIPEDIRSVRGYAKGLGDWDDQVRSAKLPPWRQVGRRKRLPHKYWLWRRIGRGAFRSAFRNPLADLFDLDRGEPAGVREFTV